MDKNTAKITEIRNLCQEKQIRMIDFKMTDIDGRWRHITIPVERFGEDTFTYGIGFDGSNYGYAPIEKSDMVFLPDPSTAYVDPFASVPTLTMCGNVCTIGQDGNRPFIERQPPRCGIHEGKRHRRPHGDRTRVRVLSLRQRPF